MNIDTFHEICSVENIVYEEPDRIYAHITTAADEETELLAVLRKDTMKPIDYL